MATFTSNKVSSSIQTRGDIDITSVTAEYTVTAALATSDVIQMVKIPVNAVIQEVIISTSAGVGATANLSVGDTGSTARYIASTAFTATTLARLGVHAGHGYKYTADGTLDIAAVSIATPTAGTVIRVTVIYTLGF
jgi:hypothetical protein